MMIIQGFAPAPISGFFKPEINSSYEDTGAIGGGLTFSKGITMTLRASYTPYLGEIKTYVNGRRIFNSISEYVVKTMLGTKIYSLNLEIEIRSEVPIGSGFGTSAASAFLAGLLVNKLFNLGYNLREIAYIAHEADIKFRTGLGSVCGLVKPGFVLIYRAGAPHKAEVFFIPHDDDLLVFAIWRSGISKREILSDPKIIERVLDIGTRTLDRILADPTPENFFEACWEFSLSTKLATDWVKHVVKTLSTLNGVIGVTQTQIGEAVFGMVKSNSVNMLRRFIYRLRGWRGFTLGKVSYTLPKITYFETAATPLQTLHWSH